LDQRGTLGGHTNTCLVEEDGATVPVDTGFIVYNEPNYPKLTALFAHLSVVSRPSDMSFAVSLGDGAVEYAGSSLNALYAQRRNLVSPAHQRMVWDILRFNRPCAFDLERDRFGSLTVNEYLARNRLSEVFRERYLLPMAAAIWSCPTSVMGSYPMASLAQFFKNHGLIQLADRPQWRTVVGGSHEYVKKMHEDLGGSACVDCAVRRVERRDDCVVVTLENGALRTYDQVVMAAHADQSLKMIADPSARETALLSRFGYQRNLAILHTDIQLMPRHRKVWSSWNYMADVNHDADSDQHVSVCEYAFRFGKPGSRLEVVIRQFEHGLPRLTATQIGRALPLNDVGLLRALVRTPLMTFKVMAAIHWHALKLWLRGAPFYSKPIAPKQEITCNGID